MAGLHPHGNPYLPNEVIAGWFGEEPENDHPIPLNDHHSLLEVLNIAENFTHIIMLLS